jgi:hypothetical protein
MNPESLIQFTGHMPALIGARRELAGFWFWVLVLGWLGVGGWGAGVGGSKGVGASRRKWKVAGSDMADFRYLVVYALCGYGSRLRENLTEVASDIALVLVVLSTVGNFLDAIAVL